MTTEQMTLRTYSFADQDVSTHRPLILCEDCGRRNRMAEPYRGRLMARNEEDGKCGACGDEGVVQEWPLPALPEVELWEDNGGGLTMICRGARAAWRGIECLTKTTFAEDAEDMAQGNSGCWGGGHMEDLEDLAQESGETLEEYIARWYDDPEGTTDAAVHVATWSEEEGVVVHNRDALGAASEHYLRLKNPVEVRS